MAATLKAHAACRVVPVTQLLTKFQWASHVKKADVSLAFMGALIPLAFNDDLAKNIIRTKNILHYDANYGVTLDSSSEAVSWESRKNKNGEVVTVTAASNGHMCWLTKMGTHFYPGKVEATLNLVKVIFNLFLWNK